MPQSHHRRRHQASSSGAVVQSKWTGFFGGWGSEGDIAAVINDLAKEGWRLVRTEIIHGVHLVGIDIAPGTYRNDDSSGFCYWERLSGFSGELDDIIANQASDSPQIVLISPSDAGFSAEDCGIWTRIGD